MDLDWRRKITLAVDEDNEQMMHTFDGGLVNFGRCLIIAQNSGNIFHFRFYQMVDYESRKTQNCFFVFHLCILHILQVKKVTTLVHWYKDWPEHWPISRKVHFISIHLSRLKTNEGWWLVEQIKKKKKKSNCWIFFNMPRLKAENHAMTSSLSFWNKIK